MPTIEPGLRANIKSTGREFRRDWRGQGVAFEQPANGGGKEGGQFRSRGGIHAFGRNGLHSRSPGCVLLLDRCGLSANDSPSVWRATRSELEMTEKGCRERPEGLVRGRSCFFCGLRPAGWWVRGPKSGENTGKCGRETKNAESSHSRRFGVWYRVLFFRRKTKSSPHRARICNRVVNGALISSVKGCPLI